MKFSFNIQNVKAIIPEEFKDNYAETHLVKYCKPFNLSHISVIEKRRLSTGAKCLLSIIDSINKPIVYSSYKGEINRSLDLLYSLAESGVISPTSFSLSVLNAIPAIASIMYSNHCDITAVSSSPSLENALLQAYINMQDTKSPQLIISYYEGAYKDYYMQDRLSCCVTMEMILGENITIEKIETNKTYNLMDYVSEVEFLKNYEKRYNYSIYSDNTEWKWYFNV